MMKYCLLVMLSIFSTKNYAEAYVFGGSTHFHGHIVHNSCGLEIKQKQHNDVQNTWIVDDKNRSYALQQLQIQYALCKPQRFDLISFKISNVTTSTNLIAAKDFTPSKTVFIDKSSDAMQQMQRWGYLSPVFITIAATYP